MTGAAQESGTAARGERQDVGGKSVCEGSRNGRGDRGDAPGLEAERNTLNPSAVRARFSCDRPGPRVSGVSGAKEFGRNRREAREVARERPARRTAGVGGRTPSGDFGVGRQAGWGWNLRVERAPEARIGTKSVDEVDLNERAHFGPAVRILRSELCTGANSGEPREAVGQDRRQASRRRASGPGSGVVFGKGAGIQAPRRAGAGGWHG